jgi:hypothetical protein
MPRGSKPYSNAKVVRCRSWMWKPIILKTQETSKKVRRNRIYVWLDFTEDMKPSAMPSTTSTALGAFPEVGF